MSVLTVFVLVLTVNTNTFFVTEHRQRGHWIKFETASRVRYILLTAALVTVLAGLKLGGTCVSQLHKIVSFKLLCNARPHDSNVLQEYEGRFLCGLKRVKQSFFDESLLLSHIESQSCLYQRHVQS